MARDRQQGASSGEDRAAVNGAGESEVERMFALGQRVTKRTGSSWTGKVVGFYSTALTPIGYAVESENEPGSVQIYPEAALTTPAPAEDDDPDDHLGGKLAAAVERELDRIEQRNSTRQDFTPAFDRELARKVIMAGFGLFSCRGWTTASGYQWMGLLETLGLDKARPVSTAPAVSRDDQALLADICDNMAEVLKPLPGELPNALGAAGTRATESGDGDEA